MLTPPDVVDYQHYGVHQSGNNFEQQVTAKQFQWLPSHFDRAGLQYVTSNIVRHCPISEIQDGCHQIGSGNNI